MTLFILVCVAVFAGLILAEAVFDEGVLVLPACVWYAVVAGLGIWLLALEWGRL